MMVESNRLSNKEEEQNNLAPDNCVSETRNAVCVCVLVGGVEVWVLKRRDEIWGKKGKRKGKWSEGKRGAGTIVIKEEEEVSIQSSRTCSGPCPCVPCPRGGQGWTLGTPPHRYYSQYFSPIVVQPVWVLEYPCFPYLSSFVSSSSSWQLSGRRIMWYCVILVCCTHTLLCTHAVPPYFLQSSLSWPVST